MLKLDHVTKTFGDFTALNDLCLTVPKGSVYGLVGPNGAGKSTAIRVLCGVYRPDKGDVTLEGEPIYENPAAKSRICVIPDEIFYFPSATMEDMKKYYQGLYETFDETLYNQLCAVFQLPKNSPIRRFSKGMQKQAAFHLAVSCRPEVLILDEPVDGLDPVMRRQIWSILLEDVSKRGTTVLVSSHNLRELEDVCDHVGILDKGGMLLERSLADMQGTTLKLQLVGPVPEQLKVLHESRSGRLQTLIVRGTSQEVEDIVSATNPAYYDLLPLSLEEIFIYELGGVNYEVKNIVL